MIRQRHIILFLLLLLSVMSMAQPRLRRPELYVGVHGGVMASTVMLKPSVANIDIMQSPLSPNGGIVFRYAGHKVCAIQAEINYMQRGWNETITSTAQPIEYYRTLDYIEVPLLMHLYFGKERFRAFLNLGPQIGYCFRDAATELPSFITQPQYQPIDKHFDWGLAGGLGFRLGILSPYPGHAASALFWTQFVRHKGVMTNITKITNNRIAHFV